MQENSNVIQSFLLIGLAITEREQSAIQENELITETHFITHCALVSHDYAT
jgi:hypothetical protein